MLEGDAEVGLCTAPAGDGAAGARAARRRVVPETRGHGTHERTIHPILMGDQEADSLLVCEVLTPAGHWSSYPPHKHDRDAMPDESFLEETYYHRIRPAQGFALQRVYTGDGALDETLAVRDGDIVLVPRGYHTVSAPPGYAALLLERDGRPGPRLGRRQRSRPRMDAWPHDRPHRHPPAGQLRRRPLDARDLRADALDVVNPATSEVLARVPLSSAGDLDAAVRAAREALPAWRAVSVIGRSQKLFALRERLVARREELARSVTMEMGKTIADARAEVGRMIEMVECACAVPTTMQGRSLEDVSRNVDCETIRQPVGVCAAIVPFNFPAMVPFWFLPFAIACGNTFILKPSEQVPLTQQIAFEVLDGLDLPPGVVNLVNGGREVVEGILEHPGIDAVSFVGSAPVAKIVYERAAATGKRVQALGGAKNHMVVMPDAVIDKTVGGIIGSAFGAAGQRCMAGSVVVTVGEAHERLLPPLREATEALRLGDGLDETTEVGPVVSQAACARIRGWIDRGVDEGATLAVDGRDAGRR